MTYGLYNRKKLIILRAALAALGAGIGGLSLWQYFVYFPDIVRMEYRIVITVVSAAAFALILALSAKPLYRLISSVKESITSAGARLGFFGVTATVLGLAAAGAVTYLFDIIIRRVQGIWAVRLLGDVLVFMLAAAALIAVILRYGSTGDVQERTPKIGYLITAEALRDERVLVAADALINAYVCDGAYSALNFSGGDGDGKCAERLNAMINSGAVGVVKLSRQYLSASEYASAERKLAENRRLRAVLPAGESVSADELTVDMFCPPVALTKLRVSAQTEPEKPPAHSSDDDVGGQIIIDK